MRFSILIASLHERSAWLCGLLSLLYRQDPPGDVEILVSIDGRHQTIGAKRNQLLHAAKGDYVAFIDDDDTVVDDYISLILAAIESKPDCCSLVGLITRDGDTPVPFYHSIKYSTYTETPSAFYRPPCHLSTIRRELALRVPYPDKSLSEDTEWSLHLASTGLLRTEADIPNVLYHYTWRSATSTC